MAPDTPTASPQVGEGLIWDGDRHEITAIHERTLDFTDGSTTRTVALFDLKSVEPGTWAVIGRETKRPATQRLAVVTQPAAEAPADPAPAGEG